MFPFILGNFCSIDASIDQSAAVQTRNMSKTKDNNIPLHAVNIDILDVSPETLSKLQRDDPSLKECWDKLSENNVYQSKSGSKSWFEQKDGILYRHFQPVGSNKEGWRVLKQLVVPQALRHQVLSLAHSSNFAGHFGCNRTVDRIKGSFYWKGMFEDVNRFVMSCEVCQKTSLKPPRVPLGRQYLIEAPFTRCAVDLIGPLPVSKRKYRFLLTAIDIASRYPLAIPLKKIDTITVADALVDILSNIGIPKEILSDQGGQFTGDMMKEVSRLLSFTQLKTAAWNPQCNGSVERLNGTLKQTLKRLASQQPLEWDRFVPACLFSLREVPCKTTGLSPFQMIYGKQVRSPLVILKEYWTKQHDDETKTKYQYVLDLQNRLEETCKLAQGNEVFQKEKHKAYYNKRSKHRNLAVGDKVLILLPEKKNKLELCWSGPFEITGKKNEWNYIVKKRGKEKLYNINLLKLFIDNPEPRIPKNSALNVSCSVVIQDDNALDCYDNGDTCQALKEPTINPELNPQQRLEVESLLSEYSSILTDKPGRTDLIQHSIELTSNEIIRNKPFPCPRHLRKDFQEQIDQMLKDDIIEPSVSEYNSPVFLVKKPNGKWRFTFDGRAINKITKFDSEPQPNLRTMFDDLCHAKYFSCVDLTSSFWQIEVAEKDRHLLAFTCDTDNHTYQFKRAPFGALNSSKTFCRLMRIVMKGVKGLSIYIDDLVIFSETFEEHMDILREVFRRLKDAGLTVKPHKIRIAFFYATYLGHRVGGGCKTPILDKVKAILQAPPPVTKKALRSFLGSVGWYRDFIESFAMITAPLTSALKKGMPNKIKWTPVMIQAFDKIKEKFASDPILKLPDFSKVFFLACDASNLGIGSALLQDYDGVKFPVLFLSRKLNEHEVNYSTVEKECLSIVFSIQKLRHYLLGEEFVLQTDAKSLCYLNKNKHSKNARLTRWSLILQEYCFKVQYVKASMNLLSDYLSRNPVD